MIFRRSRSHTFFKNRCSNGGSIHGKACNFIRRRIQLGCFTVNIAKFLKASILKNACQRLLIENHFQGILKMLHYFWNLSSVKSLTDGNLLNLISSWNHFQKLSILQIVQSTAVIQRKLCLHWMKFDSSKSIFRAVLEAYLSRYVPKS